MKGRAHFPNGPDQFTEIVRINIGRNAVTEIENMPVTLAVTVEGIAGLLPYDFRIAQLALDGRRGLE